MAPKILEFPTITFRFSCEVCGMVFVDSFTRGDLVKTPYSPTLPIVDYLEHRNTAHPDGASATYARPKIEIRHESPFPNGYR